MITIQQVSHTTLSSFLRKDDLFTLFSRYVCRQKPQSKSPAAITPSGIAGAAVTGCNCGLPHVYSFWLAADSPEAAALTLEWLRDQKGEGLCLNFPLEYTDIVREIFPKGKITRDHFYTLAAPDFSPVNSPFPIRPLTPKTIKKMTVSKEMAPMIGEPESLSRTNPIYEQE